MIHSLTGTIRRLALPNIEINVNGIGYLVTVPLPVWEKTGDNRQATIITYTYVREDRLELFGFLTENDRTLFAELINLSGVGPKMALELISIPRSALYQAVMLQDVHALTQVKGVGKKTAEKLLVDLKSVFEKHPDAALDEARKTGSAFDTDALAALIALGYDQTAALHALKDLPQDIVRTEDRVTAALRSIGHQKHARR